jgi:hypothetical protein
VPARLLVFHQRGPDAERVQIFTGLIHQCLGIGGHEAGKEPFAHQGPLAVTAIGVESITHHRFAVAHDIGDQRHHRARHLGEIDVRVGDGRGDGNGLFVEFDNAHFRSP